MKRFAILGSLVILVVALWTGAWFYISNRIQNEVGALANLQPRITCAKLNIGGFPFRIDITCTNFSFQDGDITVDVAKVQAVALVYRPTHVQIFAEQPMQISDAFAGSQTQLTWSNAKASVRMDGFKLARASLVVEQPKLTDELIGSSQILAGEHFELHLIDGGAQSTLEDRQNLNLYAFLVQADAPLVQIEQAEIKLDVEITAMPNDVRIWNSPELRTIWRAGEGNLRLHDFSMESSELSFSAKGSGTITPDGYLTGEAKLTSAGLIDRLQASGNLPPMVMALIAGTKIDENNYEQSLSIDNGVLSLGGIPLLKTPKLF